MFDYVTIKFVRKILKQIKYEFENMKNFKEDVQKFRISKNSTFMELKTSACAYWVNIHLKKCLENEEEYIFADYSEAIIYFNDMEVEEYLKFYSIFSPTLKFLPLMNIKRREIISNIQSQTICDGNKLLKSKKKNVFKI